MRSAILVLNLGSSSLKFALYSAEGLDVLCRGVISAIGASPGFSVTGAASQHLVDLEIPHDLDGHEALTHWLLDGLRTRMREVVIVAAGHRVVHGGTHFTTPVQVDDFVVARLNEFVALAPDHQPHNLAGIRAVSQHWPDLIQVACFDTEFHRTQPRLAQLFALPFELTDEGILRYGFHGLSYAYIASVLPEHARERADARVVVAHLGSGASMCAMRERRSVATTMGFTALDGLMMGTRSGAIDPGVVLYFMRHKGMSTDEVAHLLGSRSGLLGVSGLSADTRVLEASSDPRAREALNLFAYRCARELGSLMAALGGLDVLVFTGGIGEHAANVRQRICELSAWTGLVLDRDANARGAGCISAPTSAVDVLVIPTNEELVVARATRDLALAET